MDEEVNCFSVRRSPPLEYDVVLCNYVFQYVRLHFDIIALFNLFTSPLVPLCSSHASPAFSSSALVVVAVVFLPEPPQRIENNFQLNAAEMNPKRFNHWDEADGPSGFL